MDERGENQMTFGRLRLEQWSNIWLAASCGRGRGLSDRRLLLPKENKDRWGPKAKSHAWPHGRLLPLNRDWPTFFSPPHPCPQPLLLRRKGEQNSLPNAVLHDVRHQLRCTKSDTWNPGKKVKTLFTFPTLKRFCIAYICCWMRWVREKTSQDVNINRNRNQQEIILAVTPLPQTKQQQQTNKNWSHDYCARITVV